MSYAKHTFSTLRAVDQCDLSGVVKAVLHQLVRRCQTDRAHVATSAAIASGTGFGRTSVFNALAKLEDAGLIRRIPRFRGRMQLASAYVVEVDAILARAKGRFSDLALAVRHAFELRKRREAERRAKLSNDFRRSRPEHDNRPSSSISLSASIGDANRDAWAVVGSFQTASPAFRQAVATLLRNGQAASEREILEAVGCYA